MKDVQHFERDTCDIGFQSIENAAASLVIELL